MLDENVLYKSYKKVLLDISTSENKNYFDNILSAIINRGEFNLESALHDYLKEIRELSKLAPGMSLGLCDEKYNIKINTFIGKNSDIPNDCLVDESSRFDLSSMTKFFSSIFLYNRKVILDF